VDVSRAKAAAARRKTLRMHEGNRRSRQRLGVRQSSGALERGAYLSNETNQPKPAEK
jgi:hypothetical protein